VGRLDRRRLDKLERLAQGEIRVIRCPACGEVFRVHRNASVAYLAYWWAQGRDKILSLPGKSYRKTPQEVMLASLVEHPHDASEFVDTATGDPWLGEFFRGVEREFSADTPDLSEQAEAGAGSR
jgi:hypothetical protein